MTNENKTLIMNIVGGMNSVVRGMANDENQIDRWLTYGVPDGEVTEEDLEFYADDMNEFACLCRLFASIVTDEWGKDND